MDDDLVDLMLCTDRKSVIDKLYDLQNEDRLNCDKRSLDLIFLNLPIVVQLFYNDTDNNAVEILSSGNYDKVKTLLESVQKSIKLKYDKHIPYISFIKSPDQSKVYEKDVLYNPRDLSLLQTFSAAKLMENDHEFPLKKAKLDNVQITQAISNGTDIRSQMR